MPRKSQGKYKPRQLTAKHKLFLLAYMANGHNATRAAITAGYPPKNADILGWQLIHCNAIVKKEIDRMTELATKKCEINAIYVLGSLKEVADACKVRRQEIGPDGQMVERGVVDSSGANRALELLGKNLKLFVDQIDLNRRSELADISDEELLKAVKGALNHKEK